MRGVRVQLMTGYFMLWKMLPYSNAETSATVIVYNSNNGKLFYNANDIEAEFGTGGQFINLTNIPSISKDDFLMRK